MRENEIQRCWNKSTYGRRNRRAMKSVFDGLLEDSIHFISFSERYARSASAILSRKRDSDIFAFGECGGKHKLFSSLRSRDILGFAERDIFALQMRYYLASEIAIYSPVANVVESTLHINPHALCARSALTCRRHISRRRHIACRKANIANP